MTSPHVISLGLREDLIDFFDGIGPFLFYAIVFALVFAGTALFLGVFIPFITGDTLLFAAGLVTAAHADLNIIVLAVGVGVAAFFGDQVGFLIGRHAGRAYLDKRQGKRIRQAIHWSERFYDRYGWWSIVVARFVPFARVIIPVVAGVGRMNYYRFLSSNIVGALLWGVGLSLTGYFAASIPGVKNAAYIIAGIVITLSIIAGFRTWHHDRAERRAAADTTTLTR
ncbi:MAG TPA: DedA family protein [Terrimesophilobacter sp.]|nr:DedA family protein [Terrimesophilobacter sp.]HRP99439.1 DedA family protein [Terrimesophilobacter sp.]